MAKYLVPCACGRRLAVDTGQAGESLVCDCGATVAVPTLRQLRQLPATREESAPVGGPAWGFRQGAITVSLLLAAVCLIVATASRMSERPVPTIDPAARTSLVDRQVTAMTPLDAWQSWNDSYQSLSTTGFEVYKHPATDAMQQNLDWHRWIQWSTLGLAAVFVAAAAVGWMVPKSASQATRPSITSRRTD
jgi:hypothetical protein